MAQRRLRGRVRRRPLLLAVLAAGALALVLLVALGTRPSVGTVRPVSVPDAQVGTTYAFDGAVCLTAPTGATVVGVEVEQAPGGRTRVVLPPPDEPPTVAFPVAADASGGEVVDYRVPVDEDDCELRLLLTPDREGEVRAGTVRVRFRYGPGGLLRRTGSVDPAVSLDVTGSGRDPRL